VGTSGDDPSCAVYTEHIVEDKDIFLIGTDGLWDNLFLPSILDILRPFIRRSDDLLDPDLIVEILGKETERFSNMPHYMSPFAK
jgi:serine/threonine protein phosphatase PrpC